MNGSRLRLTGVGEGFTAREHRFRGLITGKVLNAVRTLFPETDRAELGRTGQGRPTGTWEFRISRWVFSLTTAGSSFWTAALDAMSMNLLGNSTTFRITARRQLLVKSPFPFQVMNRLEGRLKSRFRERASRTGSKAQRGTGRSQVPRHINDEHSMTEDGKATTWI